MLSESMIECRRNADRIRPEYAPEEAARRIAAARKLLAKVLVNGDERAAAE